MPEKSGIAAGPAVGPTVCPKTGVAAATANITNEPKSRRLCMTTSLSWFVREMSPQSSLQRGFCSRLRLESRGFEADAPTRCRDYR
jgi:hypothetical protein